MKKARKINNKNKRRKTESKVKEKKFTDGHIRDSEQVVKGQSLIVEKKNISGKKEWDEESDHARESENM